MPDQVESETLTWLSPPLSPSGRAALLSEDGSDGAEESSGVEEASSGREEASSGAVPSARPSSQFHSPAPPPGTSIPAAGWKGMTITVGGTNGAWVA